MTPDYTVGMKVSEHKGIFYIHDIIRMRARPEEVERVQALTAQTDTSRVMIREEQEPGSSGIAVIDMKARSIFKGFNYKGVKTSGSKADRASIASAAAEKHHIKIVHGCRNVDEFFDELEVFPSEGYGIHDDTVDALSLAVAELGNTPDPGLPSWLAKPEGSYWQQSMGETSFGGWRNNF